MPYWGKSGDEDITEANGGIGGDGGGGTSDKTSA